MTLVVARYNEDVEWTREFPKKIIYNKGDRSTIPVDLQECVIDLPNVGRETHTYLYHVITNYDKIDDIIIFTQGNYTDHINATPTKFKEYFSNIKGLSNNFIDCKHWGEFARSYNFNISQHKGNLSNVHLTYGPWYERVFGEKYNESTLIYPGAIFSVRKALILSRSKEFYERLIKEVDYDNAPQECHFMERSWLELFARQLDEFR